LALSLGSLGMFVAGWYSLGQWLYQSPGKGRAHILLVGLLGLTLLLQTSLLALYRHHPAAIQFERLASDQASGYFSAAQEFDHLPTLLREFPERMSEFRANPHPRSKPPGIIMLYWGMEQLLLRLPALAEPLGHWARNLRCHDLWLMSLSNSALAANLLIGLLTPLVSALIIWPAYGVAARHGGYRAGWLAAGLVALMPGRLVFTPHADTLYPLLALLALYCLDTGLRRPNWIWSLAAGVVLGLATFLSLVNALAALVLGLYLVFGVMAANRRESWWETAVSTLQSRLLWQHGIVLVLGTLSLWLLYWLTSRVTPFDIYAAAAPARHDLGRSYGLWLVGNLYDLAIFTGLPAFLLALWLGWRQRSLKTAVTWPLHLAFWPLLGILLLSGSLRGEVGRIWLMLAPFPVLLAAAGRAEWRPHQRQAWLLIIVTALASWVMATRLNGSVLEWPDPEPRPILWQAPAMDKRQVVDFGPDLRLLGYDVDQNASTLELTLYWQARQRPDVAYTVFIHLQDSAGQIVAQRDVMPQNGRLPTTCWQTGETIVDSHTLSLADLPPDRYTLQTGLYEQASGERLGQPAVLTTIKQP
ncbi:MAG: hypothetical protein R6X32_08140, partial [Chloroflexota bacterium]